MKQNNLQGVTEFIEVARQKSFTAAAESLSLSRPRISQIISQLEQRLGVRLIRRTTRTVQLTEAGALFLNQAERGMSLLEQAFEELQHATMQLKGRIRINAVGGYFGEQLLWPALSDFQKTHPTVELQLDFASHHVDVIAEQYDLAIRMGRLTDSALVARPLFQVANYTCASPDYLAKYGQPDTPKSLCDHRLIHGSNTRWSYLHRDSGVEELFHAKGEIQCPNGWVQRQACLDGLGIARLPAYYVQEALQQGTLLSLLTEWQAEPSQVSLIYPEARHKLYRVELLITHLLAWPWLKSLTLTDS